MFQSRENTQKMDSEDTTTSSDAVGPATRRAEAPQGQPAAAPQDSQGGARQERSPPADRAPTHAARTSRTRVARGGTRNHRNGASSWRFWATRHGWSRNRRERRAATAAGTQRGGGQQQWRYAFNGTNFDGFEFRAAAAYRQPAPRPVPLRGSIFIRSIRDAWQYAQGVAQDASSQQLAFWTDASGGAHHYSIAGIGVVYQWGASGRSWNKLFFLTKHQETVHTAELLGIREAVRRAVREVREVVDRRDRRRGPSAAGQPTGLRMVRIFTDSKKSPVDLLQVRHADFTDHAPRRGGYARYSGGLLCAEPPWRRA
ncbi:hypothetical protein VTK73DRAFT_5960 [Phialemonium thermophilum]|uniref:RNase H type-1 domain-containing protein n=1 Tax=Phialemonium thermophilum TaxID=223376 RepID=A0ABR3WLF8_9PEZI